MLTRPPCKILFHHIPKTGGSSLVSHARAHFGARVYEGRYDHQVDEAAILDKRYAFYHGHFTRGFVLRFREMLPQATIFSFVRHPFNRTMSQFYNWTDRARVARELDKMSVVSGESAELIRLRAKFETTIFGMSLERFLRCDDADVLSAIDNLQSQYMTLADGRPHHARFNAAAFNAISFYDFIGVQELYAPSLRILESKCGLPPGCLGGQTRENTSDYAKPCGRYQVTSGALHWLERRNVYDLALYHSCYTLLLKQYADWLPPEAFDLERAAGLPELVDTPIEGLSARRRGDRLAPSLARGAC